MGKLAVFTVFRNTNYGAVLQAYASTTFLKNKTGEDVFLVDYIRDQNTNLMHNGIIYYGKHGRKSINSVSIKKCIKAVLNYTGTVARTREFIRFIDSFLSVYSQKFYSDDKIVLEGFDYYILGSDQIWNPDIMKGFHDAYFGITETQPKKIIAYAPSIGKLSFSKEEEIVFLKKVKHIDALSCREVKSCKYLEELTGKEVKCVADPTLLLSREDWLKICDENVRLPDKYILVYSLKFDRQLMKVAQKKALEIGAKVILLGSGAGKPIKGLIYMRAFGPAQFIAAINKASYVYTDSFHGTVFSILFGKQFVTRANGEKGQRMESLCRILGIEDRVFREYGDMPAIEHRIDYQNVYRALGKLRKDSIEYIVENMMLDTDKTL